MKADALPAHGLQEAKRAHKPCSAAPSSGLESGRASLKFQGCLKSSRCSELTGGGAQRSQGRAETHCLPQNSAQPHSQLGFSEALSILKQFYLKELRRAMLGSQRASPHHFPGAPHTEGGALWLRAGTWVQVLAPRLLARQLNKHSTALSCSHGVVVSGSECHQEL